MTSRWAWCCCWWRRPDPVFELVDEEDGDGDGDAAAYLPPELVDLIVERLRALEPAKARLLSRRAREQADGAFGGKRGLFANGVCRLAKTLCSNTRVSVKHDFEDGDMGHASVAMNAATLTVELLTSMMKSDRRVTVTVDSVVDEGDELLPPFRRLLDDLEAVATLKQNLNVRLRISVNRQPRYASLMVACVMV